MGRSRVEKGDYYQKLAVAMEELLQGRKFKIHKRAKVYLCMAVKHREGMT